MQLMCSTGCVAPNECIACCDRCGIPHHSWVNWYTWLLVMAAAVCNTPGPGAGADILSHECTFSNEDADKARVAMHSTAAMAGVFARQLQARRLVLTHFSGRYKTTGDARNSSAVADNSSNTQVHMHHCLLACCVLGTIEPACAVLYFAARS
jgi:hypothetical protein